ncbi:hypothetical protein FRC11_009020 [Ceratobasidium sp. 423]|nr:hypothetical protein FRC11_009020 [Ceratobasidium sp. 423]
MQSLLGSLPALKSLVLNFYEIDQTLLKSLVSPPKLSSPKPTLLSRFPKLDVLEIYAATFRSELSNLKAEFNGILDNHSIRRMVLGGKIKLPANRKGATPLDEGDEVVRWLRTRISQFYIAHDPDDAPEDQAKWELWDV